MISGHAYADEIAMRRGGAVADEVEHADRVFARLQPESDGEIPGPELPDIFSETDERLVVAGNMNRPAAVRPRRHPLGVHKRSVALADFIIGRLALRLIKSPLMNGEDLRALSILPLTSQIYWKYITNGKNTGAR